MKLFSKDQIQEFTELDYSIYNFVMEHSEKVPYMTIRELATEAHVSTASVTRFCTKVDCDGFSEFKVHFKLYLESQRTKTFDHDLTVVESFLSRMRQEAYEKEILEVASVLEAAKSLIFIGMGNSGVIAHYASRYFSSIGKFAVNIDNPMYPVDVENPEDVVIVYFSVEGEMILGIDNINLLKRKKATIVSITNSKKSTLAKLSDYNLAYYVQREAAVIPNYHSKVDVTTQVPALILIETLAKKVHDIRLKKEEV